MDDSYHRRRQHEQTAHHTSQSRFQPSPQANRSQVAGIGERYRPSSVNTPPPLGRGLGTPGSYSGYYQEPTAAFASPNMPTAATMGYGGDYSQDGRGQQQGFGGYQATNMMYNVPNPNQQASVYDATQFGQRQTPALQIMTPDVTSTYFGSEASGGTGPNIPQGAAGGSTQTSVYQQTPAMSYTSVGGTASVQQTPGSGDVTMADEPEYADGALEEKWANYQQQLSSVFQDISTGSLESASETLLSISNWLLTQVVDLGLTLDDVNLHADRLKMWDNFNHAWLGLAYRHIEILNSRQGPSGGQRVLSEDTIKKLGNELIRLCDGIERHGLVDYQYGVWEEQIESILEDCLDLVQVQEGTE